MKKLLPILPTALAVVVLSSWSQAAEPPGRGPHGPEMMFKRLDANKDGKVTAIAVESSAARNGMLIDHNLLEVKLLRL